jgi:hypothetical protein
MCAHVNDALPPLSEKVRTEAVRWVMNSYDLWPKHILDWSTLTQNTVLPQSARLHFWI